MDGHRFLQQNNLTDCDLVRPEILSTFSSKFGLDALLSATVSVENSSYTMDFVLRDLAGKELSHSHYSEPYTAGTTSELPVIRTQSRWSHGA